MGPPQHIGQRVFAANLDHAGADRQVELGPGFAPGGRFQVLPHPLGSGQAVVRPGVAKEQEQRLPPDAGDPVVAPVLANQAGQQVAEGDDRPVAGPRPQPLVDAGKAVDVEQGHAQRPLPGGILRHHRSKISSSPTRLGRPVVRSSCRWLPMLSSRRSLHSSVAISSPIRSRRAWARSISEASFSKQPLGPGFDLRAEIEPGQGRAGRLDLGRLVEQRLLQGPRRFFVSRRIAAALAEHLGRAHLPLQPVLIDERQILDQLPQGLGIGRGDVRPHATFGRDKLLAVAANLQPHYLGRSFEITSWA